jgi:hypothetical protein
MSRVTDARIIEGLVADDADERASIVQAAGGEAALQARARAIGLTRELIKQCRLSGTRPAQRACMKCDKTFLSWGVQNRLCRRCS